MNVLLTVLKIFCFPFLLLRWLIKLWITWDKSPTCLVGKTTIVTGANTGIGYYTAQDFAKRGARVILACRDRDKSEKARAKLINVTGNSNIVVKLIDFTSLKSVRDFAKDINETERSLDILVNNAGATGYTNKRSDDGLNLLMQINYFGPFLLTLLLIDLLKKSAPSRIINVSSSACYFAKLNPNDLNKHPRGNRSLNYANSKLCNILFTIELARRLRGTGVVANSLHPGIVKTEIFRKSKGFIKILINAFKNITFKTAEEGAQTTIYVAVSPDIAGVTGQHFDNCTIAWFPPIPPLTQNKIIARKVWENSVEIVKLSVEEQRI